MATDPISTDTTTGAIEDVAKGQRLMILAIIVNVVAYIMSSQVDPTVGLLVALLGLGLAITGMGRATTGLGFSTGRKVFYIIGLFIPLVSLILLASVSSQATKVLRAKGYKVGLLGAKAP